MMVLVMSFLATGGVLAVDRKIFITAGSVLGWSDLFQDEVELHVEQ